ncbi:hypothetical protein FHU30_005797 [Actinomadura rupiterrae]|nr:hypothetical protein [Actinomadura rupiterrae]
MDVKPHTNTVAFDDMDGVTAKCYGGSHVLCGIV